MKSENSAQIQKAFTQQAVGFESRSMNFSKQDYLDYAVARVAPEASDALLEVAAGTCVCGRAFAPRVRSVVCLDMTAAEEPLRSAEDALEILRDPSHVRNLSQPEMLALYKWHGLNVDCCETIRMPVRLDSWMARTATPPKTQAVIRAQMEAELTDGAPTGFYPYRRTPRSCSISAGR